MYVAEIRKIKNEKNAWTIVVFLGRDENGKKITKSKKFNGTKPEAKQFATIFETQLKQQSGNLDCTMFLEDYLKYWLESINGEIDERTLETYTYHVNRLIPIIGKIKLIDLRLLLLKDKLKHLNDELAPKTIKGIYGTLRTAIRKAIEWELINKDVTQGLKAPKNVRKDRQVLNWDEIKLVKEHGKEYKLYPIILILLTTGMRLSECLGLKWRDLDFSQNTITIQRAINTKTRTLKDGTKTFNSLRTIILDKGTIEVLKQHKENIKVRPIKFDETLIFNEDDRPVRAYAVNICLKRILKKVNLPDMRVHDLRHTAASIMLDSDFSLAEVAYLLGDTIETITRTYAHKVKKSLNIIDSIQSKLESKQSKLDSVKSK